MKVNHTVDRGEVSDASRPILMAVVRLYIETIKKTPTAPGTMEEAEAIRNEFQVNARNAVTEGVKAWSREALEEAASEYLHRSILDRLKEVAMDAMLNLKGPDDIIADLNRVLAKLEKEAEDSGISITE